MKGDMKGKFRIPYEVLDAARVQLAVDKNKKLKKWQKQKTKLSKILWNLSADIDYVLRENESIKSISLDLRFECVVNAVTSIMDRIAEDYGGQ